MCRERPPAGEGAVPAAPGGGGAGWGRSAGRRRLRLGLGLGLGLGLQLGPCCTCDSATLLLRCCPARARCPMAPSRLQLGLRAAYSGFSSVAGFSIFFVWTVVYRQPGTAAMGGLAGISGGGARGGRGWGGVELSAPQCAQRLGRRCPRGGSVVYPKEASGSAGPGFWALPGPLGPDAF